MSGRQAEAARIFIILVSLIEGDLRDIHNAGDLLFSFAVFAAFPLLFAAVVRCYFALARFKKPGFLRQREVPPLYFPGIISGISERRGRDRGFAGVALDRHLLIGKFARSSSSAPSSYRRKAGIHCSIALAVDGWAPTCLTELSPWAEGPRGDNKRR